MLSTSESDRTNPLLNGACAEAALATPSQDVRLCRMSGAWHYRSTEVDYLTKARQSPCTQ